MELKCQMSMQIRPLVSTAASVRDKSVELKAENPGNTLGISDLNESAADGELRSLFGNCGIVDRVLMINDNTSSLIINK